MNFIDESSEEVRLLARAVARDKLADPPGQGADDAFSRHKVKALADAGLLGMGLSKDVGGGGARAIDVVLVTEELAKVSTSAAFVFSAQNGLGAKAIAQLGSPAMRDKYMPGILTGEILTAWGMSEPGGGSDLGNMRTYAKEGATGYVLSGEKTWISMAQHSRVFVVICRFNDTPGLKGLGAVVVDRENPGIEVGPHIDTMGVNGSGMASVYLDSCEIPREEVLIPPGGYKDLLEIMSGERIVSNPPISLGLAAAAYEATAEYLKGREAFGKPLSDNQGLRWRLAEMALDLDSARLLVYRAAHNMDQGRLTIAEAAMAKIAANEAALRITDAAVLMHGAAGYTREVGVERLARDARGMAIGDGTVHIQRNLLAGQLLGRVSS